MIDQLLKRLGKYRDYYGVGILVIREDDLRAEYRQMEQDSALPGVDADGRDADGRYFGIAPISDHAAVRTCALKLGAFSGGSWSPTARLAAYVLYLLDESS